MRAYKLVLLLLSAATLLLGLPQDHEDKCLSIVSGIDFKVTGVTVTVSNPTQHSGSSSGANLIPTQHAGASLDTNLIPVQPLEARDKAHISGQAPNAIWRLGKCRCQYMYNSVLWRECMENFQHNLGLFYNAMFNNDRSTASRFNFQRDGHWLFQSATDECELTEGSDTWITCMEQFRNEVTVYYNNKLKHLTAGQDDDPKRDVQEIDSDVWNPFDWSDNESGFPDVNECDAGLPTEPGQTTTHHLSAQGQEYTAVLALEHAKPHLFKDTFLASGTKHTVIISQFPDDPTRAAQTVIWGSQTNVQFTSTSDASCIGKLTSVDFGLRFPKRSPTFFPVDERPTQTVNVRPPFTTTYSGSTVPITAPTQVIGSTTFIRNTPGRKYHRYNPDHPVAPTGSCHKNKQKGSMLDRLNLNDDDAVEGNWPREIHEYNDRECHIERCMWEYMRPMNHTTVTNGVLVVSDFHLDPYGSPDHHTSTLHHNYFTYQTHLHGPHWGLTEDHDVYYPRTASLVANHSTIAIVGAWATPASMSDKQAEEQHVHLADPECEDMDSCLSVCQQKNPESSFWEKYWPWIVGSLGLFLLLLLFICCCCCFRRRSKKDPQRRRSSLAEKLKRKPSEKPQDVVTNQTTGQSTDQNGNLVSPETAAPTSTVAGSAAGAEAARRGEDNGEQSGNDGGRGTTGRRAEEGRGRVNFEDGGKPGQEQPSGEPKPEGEPKQTTTGESTEPKPMEHAEPQPVPDKDGAGDAHGTGRLGLDANSLRGRKRNRPEGIAGLGF